MLMHPDKNPSGSPISEANSIVPDPWETKEPKPNFPSPLELDRLLRGEPHPLIRGAEELLELAPAGVPGAGLLPAHMDNADIDPVKVLLNNELKLHDYFVENFNFQVEQALTLLYWLAAQPEQRLA